MRCVVVVTMLVGLLAAVPGVAHADALCSDFMKMNDDDKTAVVEDIRANGGSDMEQVVPDNYLVIMATDICRGYGSEMVSEALTPPSRK